MKLQVLVATMKQKNFSLLDKMNIRCDAVIANQADHNEIVSKDTAFGKATMITTTSKNAITFFAFIIVPPLLF